MSSEAMHSRSVLDILTDEGRWVKGVGRDADGRLCLGIALQELRVDPGLEAGRRLEAAIRLLYPERVGNLAMPIVAFNDHPGTTFEDVRRVCKVAGV